jgi:hypothetical protein
MEKWKLLIKRVQEQADAGMEPARLLVTVQLLQEELMRLTGGEPVISKSSSVTVMLPGFRRTPDLLKSLAEEEQPEATTAGGSLPAETDAPAKVYSTVNEPVPAAPAPPVENKMESPREVWRLDPVLETPTLAHQDEIKELNELMGRLNGESLNDRLKVNAERNDISSFLTETPVRDLKKAIGINDRFLFVNELFRGDEDMYERSVRTINNFRILAEAEYWIERELTVKLGWDVNSGTVREFYKLVKRRFS